MQTPFSIALEPSAAMPAPAAEAPSLRSESDLKACRQSMRHGSRTFAAASLLLPRRVHEPACALYAFCRLADDTVDGPHTDRPLQRLRRRLDLAYTGTPEAHPADRALAHTVERHRIPRSLFDALLEGFEWDLEGRRYETVEALHEYGARVAGTVGAMMSLLMGARSPQALARACDLGVAMQLSNIARDVGEDARMGRLYLPVQWMHDAGIDADGWLATPAFTPALASVIERLLQAAQALYDRVGPGVALLPWSCRPGINAARFMYAQIGHEVARRGFDSVDGRARVPAWRKGITLCKAMAACAVPAGASTNVEPLAASRFLVAAASQPMPPLGVTPAAARRSMTESLVWTMELFARLERRDAAWTGPGRQD